MESVKNLRMIDNPDKIMGLPIDHFDGLDKFEDEPSDGRKIKDLWRAEFPN